MKNKRFKNFMTGFLSLLPVLLFVVIIVWLYKLIIGFIDSFISIFPENFWHGLPTIIVDICGFILLCAFIWLIGFIMNQKHVGVKLKSWLHPIVNKVPLLNSLFKITSQVTSTLQSSNSFQRVVLVKFPIETAWSIGFITADNLEIFEKCINEPKLYSIFVPTTPNPTNGYLVMMTPENVMETDVPVSDAVSFIISMGTAGATAEVLKKSYS